MAIYLDGKEYQDEAAFEAAMNPAIPDSLKRVYIPTENGEVVQPKEDGDNNVRDPQKVIQDRQNAADPGLIINDQGDQVDYDFSKGQDLLNRMPLESPEKPADALKSEAGTGVPDGISTSPEPSNGLSMVGAVGDWLNRQMQYPEKFMNAVRGMANPSTDEDLKLLKATWESAKEFFMHPGNVYQGKADPGDVEKALNMATMMVFGPMPVAKSMADGTLGSFIGVRSKSFDRTRLYKAQNMEMDGAHPDAIWKETGTFRGADGRWRQEVPDLPSKLNEKAFDKTVIGSVEDPLARLEGGPRGWTSVGGLDTETWTLKAKGFPKLKDNAGLEDTLKFLFQSTREGEGFVKLSEVLNHPELYKAYPELKNIKVATLPDDLVDKGIKGQVSGDTIYLAPDLDPAFIRSVLLHEAQHVIQKVEGFARGGNALEFKPSKLAKAEEQFNKVKEDTLKDLSEHYAESRLKQTINKIKFAKDLEGPAKEAWENEVLKDKQFYTDLRRPEDFKRLESIAKGELILERESAKQHELYKRLAGEVEARNVQTRMDFSDVKRLLNSPRFTEDKPRFIQQNLGQTEFLSKD